MSNKELRIGSLVPAGFPLAFPFGDFVGWLVRALA